MHVSNLSSHQTLWNDGIENKMETWKTKIPNATFAVLSPEDPAISGVHLT